MLQYAEAGQQTVHYFVLPPFKSHVDGFGSFQASKAWLDEPDPFGRTSSVMPWDRESKKHVLHDPRWVPLHAPQYFMFPRWVPLYDSRYLMVPRWSRFVLPSTS